MRKLLLGGAAAAAVAMAMPAGAQAAEPVCLGNTTTGACVFTDAACAINAIRSLQPSTRCAHVEIYREFIPPGA